VDSLGKADIISVLNRDERGLEVGKYVVKGHKLSQVSLIPVGPHSSVCAPIAEDGLGVLGTGVVHQVNHQFRPFLIEQTPHSIVKLIQVPMKG